MESKPIFIVFHNIYIPYNYTFLCIGSNQPGTFSPTQRVPVGAYGERQALNIGVSGAGDKPFLGLCGHDWTSSYL
jgi:hypothetical protein